MNSLTQVAWLMLNVTFNDYEQTVEECPINLYHAYIRTKSCVAVSLKY